MSVHTDTQTCVNDWCDRPSATRGFCRTCYNRGRQAGDITRAAMRPHEIDTRRREDIDEIAVQRLIAGDPPARITVGEHEAAIRHLYAAGLSNVQIAARIGVSAECVRYRRRSLGLLANHTQQHQAA